MNDVLPLVIANHKANKDWQEVKDWLKVIGPQSKEFDGTIIFCPALPFISGAYEEIKTHHYKIKLGAQDVSQFEAGSYTGEVSASQLAGIVDYVIVGHSERRDNFLEDETILQTKVNNVQNLDIDAIYCIQTATTPIAKNTMIVAYEPPFAIGTGNPDTLENIAKVSKQVKEISPYIFLYGGSVSKDNATHLSIIPGVDGLLVGATHSLDPHRFSQILKAI